MDKETYLRERDESNAVLEGMFGIRLLTAYQCIKCGSIFDGVEDIFTHLEMCRNIKP